jgi:DNA-directed RNA polymerase subunit RPC12/RpoP
MNVSDELIAELQETMRKNSGKDVSWESAQKEAFHLARFAEAIYNIAEKDYRREQRLKKEPKGFLLDEVGYTCAICSRHTGENEAWYDKYGIKCITCQKGIDKKQIPASMAKNKDAWYSSFDLQSRFNIKSPTLRKWVRKGIIKARSISNESGGTHVQIFLIKDNKDFLPPKTLTKSHTEKVKKANRNSYHIPLKLKFAV